MLTAFIFFVLCVGVMFWTVLRGVAERTNWRSDVGKWRVDVSKAVDNAIDRIEKLEGEGDE